MFISFPPLYLSATVFPLEVQLLLYRSDFPGPKEAVEEALKHMRNETDTNISLSNAPLAGLSTLYQVSSSIFSIIVREIEDIVFQDFKRQQPPPGLHRGGGLSHRGSGARVKVTTCSNLPQKSWCLKWC